MSDLKPCPFCGGEHSNFSYVRDGESLNCNTCGARFVEYNGPANNTARMRLVKKWNTRPAPVPRVKPLEWVNASGGFEATSLLGVWRILWRPDGMFSVTLNGEIVGGICTTFEKAKAAAFEHHEHRILSALDMEKDDG